MLTGIISVLTFALIVGVIGLIKVMNKIAEQSDQPQ
ncbi:hypothetical protein AAKU64_000258 [Undibacterium sp. GrIS 1.8]